MHLAEDLDLDRVVVPGQGQVLVPDQVLDQVLAVELALESALDLELELAWVWGGLDRCW